LALSLARDSPFSRQVRIKSGYRKLASLQDHPAESAAPPAPFADISVPSVAMIGYACAYMLGALAIAIYHFERRDL
jgi:hypothetical protein